MRKFVAIGGLAGLVIGAQAIASEPVPAEVPEENYDFLVVKSGPCIPKIGVGIDPNYAAECQRLTEPRRYRGTWVVGFETSLFTPIGKLDCVETKGRTDCAELSGQDLPWPAPWTCPRTKRFEIEFVGRRNVLPNFHGAAYYMVKVDRLISAKQLPAPYDEDCDPKLHPELKEK